MQRCPSVFLRLRRCQQGAILIAWALILPVLIGMIGLGVETGMWYLAKRNLQSAADVAAIAGAYESTTAARVSSATSAVAANGFGTGSKVSITVNNPPRSGKYTANSNAVEVILKQPQTLLFSKLYLSVMPTITVRAVGMRQTTSSGGGCVLALATSGTGIEINGNSALTMPTCVLISNSSSSDSIDLSGSSNTNVDTLYTAGNYQQKGNSTLTKAATPTTGGSVTADPYSSVNMPAFGGCNQNAYSSHGAATLSPGVYCNGMSFNAHANVTLNPGTYVINQGTLSINGQAALSGSGVTIVLTGGATVSINGGAAVSLSAPTSGTYSGIIFYQDRSTAVGTASSFNGGSTMGISGALYMPEGAVTFNGGNGTSGSCAQIIANTVSFLGNNKLTSNCPSGGMRQITTSSAGAVSLVE